MANQQARDMRYGRQGGRVVPFDQSQADDGAICDVCGKPSVRGRHLECEPPAEQETLL